MGNAAYKKKILVSITGTGNWVELPTMSPSLDFGGEVLDDTDTSNVGDNGFRSRVLGLNDWSVNADSNWKPAHAGLTMVRNAKLNRSKLFVQYLPTGEIAEGFQGPVVVESYNQSGEVAGLETVSIALQAAGALAPAV